MRHQAKVTVWLRARVMGSVRRFEPISQMESSDSELGIGLVDEHAHLDLRCGDRLNVDPLLRQRLEHPSGDAGMAAHADAHHRYLRDIDRVRQFVKTDLVLDIG